MHKMLRFAGIAVLALALAFSACKQNTPPTPTTGTISGTVTLMAGMSGDLGNSRVAIYTTFDNWNNNVPVKSVRSTGSGYTINFSLTQIAPGTYYLDSWKDCDNNGFWSAGDLVGVYGVTQWPNPVLTEIMISAGQTITVNLDAILL